ncbi:MAG: hypothetical protein WAU88_01170, partial [Candidatus Zixiibacteriota bacterium]
KFSSEERKQYDRDRGLAAMAFANDDISELLRLAKKYGDNRVPTGGRVDKVKEKADHFDDWSKSFQTGKVNLYDAKLTILNAWSRSSQSEEQTDWHVIRSTRFSYSDDALTATIQYFRAIQRSSRNHCYAVIKNGYPPKDKHMIDYWEAPKANRPMIHGLSDPQGQTDADTNPLDAYVNTEVLSLENRTRIQGILDSHSRMFPVNDKPAVLGDLTTRQSHLFWYYSGFTNLAGPNRIEWANLDKVLHPVSHVA